MQYNAKITDKIYIAREPQKPRKGSPENFREHEDFTKEGTDP